MLNKIPFVSRLFKKVEAPQEFERIGVDFDFEVCQDCQTCPPVAPTIRPTVRPQLFVISRASHKKGTACEEGRCENGRCEEDCGEEVCGEDCDEASACCRAASESAKHGGPSWERIVELTAKNAALEAMLDAQTAFHEEKSELTDSVVEILMENAKLQAQVETQAKQADLTKELLTLVSENAKLKAQAELAEERLALVQQMAKLAVENEHLKVALHVATIAKGQPYTPAAAAEIETSNRVPVSQPAR